MTTIFVTKEEVISTDMWDVLEDMGLEETDMVTILADDGETRIKTMTDSDFEYLQSHEEEEIKRCLEYWEQIWEGAEVKEVLDRFRHNNSRREWEDYIHDVMEIPEWLESYIDWEDLIRDVSMDYAVTDNYVFSE